MLRFICHECFDAAEQRVKGFSSEAERQAFLKKCKIHTEEHRVSTSPSFTLLSFAKGAYVLFFDSWLAATWKQMVGSHRSTHTNSV